MHEHDGPPVAFALQVGDLLPVDVSRQPVHVVLRKQSVTILAVMRLQQQAPPPFSVVPVTRRSKPGRPGHGSGCLVSGMDVGDDGLDRLLPEPGYERQCGLCGDAAALP